MNEIPSFEINILRLTPDERLQLQLSPKNATPLSAEGNETLRLYQDHLSNIQPLDEAVVHVRMRSAMQQLARQDFKFKNDAEWDSWGNFIERNKIECFHFLIGEYGKSGLPKGQRNFIERELHSWGPVLAESFSTHIRYLQKLIMLFGEEVQNTSYNLDQQTLAQAIIGLMNSRIEEMGKCILSDAPPPDVVASDFTRNAAHDHASRFMQPERGRRGSKR